MAQRRMFSLKIVDTDDFLAMPQSSRLLYYDLSMRADDDGFVSSPQKIMKMTGSSEDDYKILCAKQYIIPFKRGICVIKDWKIHNYIQKDRYSETHYKEEKKQLSFDENGSYTKCIQIGHNMDTQVRLGKVRLGKVRLGKVRLGKVRLGKDSIGKDSIDNINDDMLQCNNDETPHIIDLFNNWWNLYDKKRGKEKTFELWKKLNPDEKQYSVIMAHTLLYVSEIEKQFRKDPERYIKYKCWNDEVISKSSKQKTQSPTERMAEIRSIVEGEK